MDQIQSATTMEDLLKLGSPAGWDEDVSVVIRRNRTRIRLVPVVCRVCSRSFAARGLTEGGADRVRRAHYGVSIVSRIGGGYLADRIGSRRAFPCVTRLLGRGHRPVRRATGPNSRFRRRARWSQDGGCATLYIPVLMQVYDPRKIPRSSECSTSLAGSAHSLCRHSGP